MLWAALLLASAQASTPPNPEQAWATFSRYSFSEYRGPDAIVLIGSLPRPDPNPSGGVRRPSLELGESWFRVELNPEREDRRILWTDTLSCPDASLLPTSLDRIEPPRFMHLYRAPMIPVDGESYTMETLAGQNSEAARMRIEVFSAHSSLGRWVDHALTVLLPCLRAEPPDGTRRPVTSH